MIFEWDDVKNVKNFRKHGVWFEEAKTVWTDELAVEFYDEDHSEREDRFIRVGRSKKNKMLLVVICERDEDIVRIVSARRLSRKEKDQYEEGI